MPPVALKGPPWRMRKGPGGLSCARGTRDGESMGGGASHALAQCSGRDRQPEQRSIYCKEKAEGDAEIPKTRLRTSRRHIQNLERKGQES